MDPVSGGEQAPLAVEISRQNGTVVVALRGELDISNVDSLERELEGALVATPSRLIFDLGQLRFLDSSGIGLLVRMTSRSSSVEVQRPSEIVKQVIECMGLAGVLGMAP
jgi:anti-sigma B factor antagonist